MADRNIMPVVFEHPTKDAAEFDFEIYANIVLELLVVRSFKTESSDFWNIIYTGQTYMLRHKGCLSWKHFLQPKETGWKKTAKAAGILKRYLTEPVVKVSDSLFNVLDILYPGTKQYQRKQLIVTWYDSMATKNDIGMKIGSRKEYRKFMAELRQHSESKKQRLSCPSEHTLLK